MRRHSLTLAPTAVPRVYSHNIASSTALQLKLQILHNACGVHLEQFACRPYCSFRHLAWRMFCADVSWSTALQPLRSLLPWILLATIAWLCACMHTIVSARVLCAQGCSLCAHQQAVLQSRLLPLQPPLRSLCLLSHGLAVADMWVKYETNGL